MADQLMIGNDITIHAPISRVWDALINPEQTKKYMYGCEVVSDFTAGSPMDWKAIWEGKETTFVTGHVVSIEPEALLVYTTFDPLSEYENIPANHLHVTYQLSTEDGNTYLSVTQGDYSSVPDGSRRYEEAAREGGWSSILLTIKEIVEANEG